jgi:hypothetical protein
MMKLGDEQILKMSPSFSSKTVIIPSTFHNTECQDTHNNNFAICLL